MNRRNLVLFCSIIVAIGSLPGAGALWSASGDLEPNYAPDVDLGLMFATPDVDPNPESLKIYFNAWLTPAGAGNNPNVGATGTSHQLPVFNNAIAFLGVWKDCNADGYIGHAESAVVEYRSELLLGDDGICPDGSIFNNEGWVYELLTVIDGASFAQNAKPVRFVNASEVRVWGDVGLPPATQPTPGGEDGGCFVNPPVGYFYSTGAILDHADCSFGHFVAQSVTELDNGEFCVSSEEAGQEVCQPAALGVGIGFDGCADGVDCESGENAQCSDSILNQKIGVWSDPPECREEGYVGLLDACGEPEARAEDAPEDTCDEENDPHPNAFFTVWDCSSVTPVAVNDPTTEDDPETQEDESLVFATLVPGGVAPTTPGASDPSHRSLSQGADEALATCDGSQNVGSTANFVETDVEQGDTKVTNDWVLDYQPPFQNRNLWEGNTCGPAAAPDVRAPPNTPVTNSSGCTPRLTPDAPSAGGTRPPIQTLQNGGPNYWTPVFIGLFLHPNVETRGSGAETTVDGEGPVYATFYAFVSTSGTTVDQLVTGEPNHFEQVTQTVLFPGGSGFYGEEWCLGDYGEGAGVYDGFNCDATLWYKDAAGGSSRPTNAAGTKNLGAIPGESYNLRDIDCFDGSLAAGLSQDLEGVGFGLTVLDTDSDGDGEADDAAGPCHLVRA